jgi:predicted enzyme related to lactoylglutathione lyase
MITKAVQISVLVSEVDEAKTYYVDVLGFSVVNDLTFGKDWRYVTVAPDVTNETVIELVKAESEAQRNLIGNQAGGQVLLMFQTDEIEADYAAMKKKGVRFSGEPQAVPGGRGVGFVDCYGNNFDLYQPDQA